MKFAKELEDDLVPEWRVKYFNYKQGKKKVKAVARALKNANRTPNFPQRPSPQAARSSDRLPFTHFDFNRRNELSEAQQDEDTSQEEEPDTTAKGHKGLRRPQLEPPMRKESLTMFAKSPPVLVPADQSIADTLDPTDSSSATERQPLKDRQSGQTGQQYRYGSFVGTPPDQPSSGRLPDLELPDPALDPLKRRPSTIKGQRPPTVSKTADPTPDAYHVGQQKTPRKKFARFRQDIFRRSDSGNSPKGHPQKVLKQVFQSKALDSPQTRDIQLQAYRELDARQDDFFEFLDKEVDKIEKFYQSKEDEASERLSVLREQLHEMRDRRMKDVMTVKKGGKIAEHGLLDGQLAIMSSTTDTDKKTDETNGHSFGIMRPVHKILKPQIKIGKTTKSMQQLGSPTGPQAQSPANEAENSNKDYVRKKPHGEDVPYRFAKRRLKLALQEFYRGLELLRSYALLNRTAFRKINKKYDKAVNARPTLQYMSQKVNTAHFVQSSVIENLLVAVEDLYARYFERGNHKVAVNKLKSKLRQGDQSPVSFRNGFYLAAGTCFGVAGLVNASRYLFSDDLITKTHTAYLLQLYGGYFLALLLFLIFVLDCRIWTRTRVNYIFVFEFDTRHVLDWRELAELPCLFLFLNGIFLWLNFEFPPDNTMFLYWPVILIGLTLGIIAFPVKTMYYHSRQWFGFSNWRLLLAGLYPVEFRDFFLGDMYCSETYTLSQIELFFCLYANRWTNPTQCNSNHSRLLGFFTTLPAIWRANQCLRRYYDTKNWFPHLANFTKYLFNILYYMTLSFYRLEINDQRKAVFIVFALVNGVYASIWDVCMDWSLGNPWAKHPFLRDQLAYRKVWVYYVAIVVNVVLRQQWIFYAIFTEDLQHSAFMSFCVGLAEVLRRGLWSIFRVENEHCNNVQQFRASRDVPLPYELKKARKSDSKSHTGKSKKDDLANASHTHPNAPGSGVGTAVDLERARTSDSTRTGTSSVRQRKGSVTPGLQALRRVGTVIAAAHAQDFQKKRRPEAMGVGSGDDKKADDSSDDDDDDDDDDNSDAHAHTDVETSDRDDDDDDGDVHLKYQSSRARPTPVPRMSSDRRSAGRSNADRTTSRMTLNQSSSVSPRDSRREGNRGQLTQTSSYLEVPTEGESERDLDAEEENEADLTEVRDRISRAKSPAGMDS